MRCFISIDLSVEATKEIERLQRIIKPHFIGMPLVRLWHTKFNLFVDLECDRCKIVDRRFSWKLKVEIMSVLL